jgi:hypothetical protein
MRVEAKKEEIGRWKRGHWGREEYRELWISFIVCSLIGLSFRCKYTAKDTRTYVSRAVQRFYRSCVR